jgi:hypothetical protein
MDHERGTIDGAGLARWAVVALLVVAGVALFFLYGGDTRPVVEPVVGETAP